MKYVIGDVHARGDLFYAHYERVIRENLRLILLGDLIDRGNTPGYLFELLADLEARGLIEAMVIGNHDWKLYRHLVGRNVDLGMEAQKSADFFDESPQSRDTFLRLVDKSYLMYRDGKNHFVHAAMVPNLIGTDSIKFSDFFNKRIPKKGMDIFLYGYTTGRILESGFPERKMEWIDRIPKDNRVFKGHDYMYDDVTDMVGALGGVVTFVDTGCGHKDGTLSGVLVE